MWGLPKNLRPHLEKALVKIEAEFREAISKPESRAWPKRKAAIEKAMQSSFAAFAAQTFVAVRNDQLTVTEARSYADQFLESRASEIYDWLAAVADEGLQGPYDFQRYDNTNRFMFSRDMADRERHSAEFPRFLANLADAREIVDAVPLDVNSRFPKRAAWLKREMDKRDHMSRNRLSELSELDRKTIERILRGKLVRPQVLSKLVKGLSHGSHPKVNPTDVPTD